MRKVRSLLVAALLLAGVGGAADVRAAGRKPGPTVTVMTRNLYLGASLDPILHATSFPGALQAVAAAWAQVQANDFPTRARGIAAEIARARPDVVGFQELVLYRTQTPSDFTLTPATQVALDYKLVLQKALKQRGLRYRFVGVNVNTDAELPSGSPPQMDVRLTVRNGLLVRDGVRVRNVHAANYPTTLKLLAGLATARRGWVSADATIGHRTFRVITTHLESFDRPTAEAQSEELLAGPARTHLPVIVLADLNSRPDGSTSKSYGNLLAGGFGDAWAQAYPDAAGLTCCHADDLHQADAPFSERIDDVLTRGGFTALRGAVTGEQASTRVGGLWPSDHGGLWMTLRLPGG